MFMSRTFMSKEVTVVAMEVAGWAQAVQFI
jgi:hypothetical protein